MWKMSTAGSYKFGFSLQYVLVAMYALCNFTSQKTMKILEQVGENNQIDYIRNDQNTL